MIASSKNAKIKKRKKSNFAFKSEDLSALCVGFRTKINTFSQNQELGRCILSIARCIARSYSNVFRTDAEQQDLVQDCVIYIFNYGIPKLNPSKACSATSYLLASANYAAANAVTHRRLEAKHNDINQMLMGRWNKEFDNDPSTWNDVRWNEFEMLVKKMMDNGECKLNLFENSAEIAKRKVSEIREKVSFTLGKKKM